MSDLIPFGAWPSPISAADVAGGTRKVGGGRYVGAEIWWSEQRSDQGGRMSIRRYADDGSVVDVLPEPWNARTRVQEYGGGAWSVTAAGELIFANFADQRLYLLVPGDEPRPLTPEPETAGSDRWASPTELPDGGGLLCIREHHAGSVITRDLAIVPLDGSGAAGPAAIRTVVGGSDFVAAPAVSPDGRWLAWMAWDHPQMPWDGTEVRIASLGADGTVGEVKTLLGSTTESVLTPTWLSSERLVVATDRSGWWNLVVVDRATGAVDEMAPMQAEVGGPMWTLDLRWWRLLPDGRVLFVRNEGTDSLGLLDISSRSISSLELTAYDDLSIGGVDGSRVLITASGSTVASGIRELDLETGSVRDVRLGLDELPAQEWLAPARLETFPGVGGRRVHAIVYPPTGPFAAPDGELPPYIVHVHGGPTAQVQPAFDLSVNFWTSRGIGVLDVNYGGSTGYGRDYREQLRGQWGVVDVEDVVAVARGLADAGLADGSRIAIEGGSAGGWTVLSALTTTDTFAAGVSYYGVAELLAFAATTHDFESRYLDGLVGPLPESHDLYVSRAPLSHVDGLSAPVLLLQGLDDPVVPPAQAEMFREALVDKGISHAYLAFEGESHGFRRAETIATCLEASLSFLGQVFGFDPPGVTPLELVKG